MKPTELRRLRPATGYIQHKLARAARVSHARLVHAELGHLKLTAEEIKKLRAAMCRAARRNPQRVEAALRMPIIREVQ